MPSSPFLLVAQVPEAASRAEAVWRAVERAVQTSLDCHVLVDHDVLVCTATAGRTAGKLSRSVPQGMDRPAGAAGVLRISVPRPGVDEPGAQQLGAQTGVWVTLSTEPAVQPPRDGNGAGASLVVEVDPGTRTWTALRGAPELNTLYYRVRRDASASFVVATQFRALLPFMERHPALDHVAVARYLCNGFFSEPESPLQGVRSVLPLTRLTGRGHGDGWESQTLRPAPATPGRTPPADAAGRRRQVREHLVQAVQAHTSDSGDVACTLSGGVDSSTVAAVAATELGKTVHTYTLVFEDMEISEAKYAQAVADRIGTRHNEVLLTQPDFEGSLDWMLGSIDLPTTDGLNSLLICRSIAAQGHNAALVGVGSDELFGGHECMQRVPRALSVLNAFQVLPSFLRTGVRSAVARLTGCQDAPWLPSHGLKGKFLALLEGRADPLDTYLLSRRVLLPQAVATLKPATPVASYFSLPQEVMARAPEGLESQTLARKISYFEQLIYLRNQLLRDMQMIGASTAVDVRAPFVDPVLVDVVGAMPADDVFGGERPKQFLIDSVVDILPTEAYKRPKLGFVLPIGQWLGGLVSSRFKVLSARRDLLDYLELDLPAVERIMADCASARGRVFYTREWCLFVLMDWCSRNLLQHEPA